MCTKIPLIHTFSKLSQHGRGDTPLPRSVSSLPRFCPSPPCPCWKSWLCHCLSSLPQVSLATWSVFLLVGLMNPKNWSSDTARMKRALHRMVKENVWSVTEGQAIHSSQIIIIIITRALGVRAHVSPDPSPHPPSWNPVCQILCQSIG